MTSLLLLLLLLCFVALCRIYSTYITYEYCVILSFFWLQIYNMTGYTFTI